MAGSLALRLNPAACDGFGYCAELLPELVDLDEWGFPVVPRDLAVPPGLLDAARRAIAFCPRRALALVPAAVPMDLPRVRAAGRR